MEFRKFNSIENAYNKDFIQKIKEEGLASEQFVVQEKAHGGNLSIWTEDGEHFITAKRTAFLDPNENFFNHQQVLEDLKPKLIKLWNHFNKENTLRQMVLYGEIIGGVYPHEEVAKNKNAIRVQKGVSYSPNNEFYAFDLLLNEKEFLTVEKLNELMKAYGFLHAKTLLTGDLAAVLQYPNTFQTLIPSQLNLPEIENNTCEGLIIRPLKNITFKNGGRIFLKNKNEKWAEKEKVSRRPKKELVISQPVQELQAEIARYVTANRLSNVLSKYGKLSMKEFGKVMGLFSQDIVEDFSKDFAPQLATLEKQEIKQITKSFSNKAIALVKNELMN